MSHPGEPRGRAVLDILVATAAAGTAYGLERWTRSADLSPFPAHFDGALSLLVTFAVVVGLNRRQGSGWGSLGLRRPARWWFVPGWGLLVLVVTVAAQLTVVPLLAAALGAPPPDLGRYDAIRGHLPMFLVSVVGAMFTGGFIEEVVYRGFMIDRLSRLLGAGRRGRAGAALLCGIPFGLVHFAWGWGGIVSTAVMGSTLGLMFLATRGNLWPLVAAHACMDFILLLQVYLGVLE